MTTTRTMDSLLTSCRVMASNGHSWGQTWDKVGPFYHELLVNNEAIGPMRVGRLRLLYAWISGQTI